MIQGTHIHARSSPNKNGIMLGYLPIGCQPTLITCVLVANYVNYGPWQGHKNKGHAQIASTIQLSGSISNVLEKVEITFS